MFFMIVYWLMRRVLGAFNRDKHLVELEAENMVLRKRLAVAERNVPRPKLRRRDRMFFAALAQLLPRLRWQEVFSFSPQTLLGWHRGLVAKKWTFKRKKVGPRLHVCGHTRLAGLRA